MRSAGSAASAAPTARCGMWGSAAFIVGSFGAGLLLDVTAAR